MTKNVLPDYAEKQKNLYSGQTSVDDLIGYGEQCLEADRIFDALEFYQRAGYCPGLEAIVEKAVSEGDAMLFEQAMRALGRKPAAEQWNRLGREALARKKVAFARIAFRAGGDEAMLVEIDKARVLPEAVESRQQGSGDPEGVEQPA